MAAAEQENVPKVTSFKGTLSKSKLYFETDSLTCNIVDFLLNLNSHCLCLGDLNFKSLKQSDDRIPNLWPHKKFSPCSLELDGRTHTLMPTWNSGITFPLPPLPASFPVPNYNHVSHNNVTVNDRSHVQRWPHWLECTWIFYEKGKIRASEVFCFLWQEWYLWG